MNKKILIWTFVSLLLVTFVFADNPYSNVQGLSITAINATGSENPLATVSNWTKQAAGGLCTSNNNKWECGKDTSMAYIHTLINATTNGGNGGNFTIFHGKVAVIDCFGVNNRLITMSSSNSSTDFSMEVRFVTSGSLQLRNIDGTNILISGLDVNNATHDLQLVVNDTHVRAYLDGNNTGAVKFSTVTPPSSRLPPAYIAIGGGFSGANTGCNVTVENFVSYNLSNYNITTASAGDTTKPFVSSQSINITTPKINNIAQFGVNCTDETAEGSVYFAHNLSGVMTNVSQISGLNQQSINYTANITNIAPRGKVIGGIFTCNDTSSNQFQSNLTTYTVADTAPTFTLAINASSSTKVDNLLQLSSLVNEADNLSMIIASWNCSNSAGTWINISNISAGLSLQSLVNYTVNVSNKLVRANTCGWLFYANDSIVNTFTSSSLNTFVVANTVPNATNFVNTTGKHYSKNVTRLNWTASNNPDGDVLNYVVYWDLDIIPTSLYYNGTDLNLTTNWTSDNTYFYQIKVMDGESESTLSPVFNLTLDTGLPTLTINISNNTFTNKNLTFNFALEDLFPYNLTVRIYRGGNTYHTNTSSVIFGRFINLTLLLNLTEDGNYTIEINGSDSDKTSPKIDNILESNKKGEAEYVMNDTINSISYKMLIRFEDKNENELITPTNYKSYANYNNKGTHIDFGMNFTSNRNIIIPTYDIQTNNVNIDILNGSMKGHLVWHPYGTDFEGKLLVNGAERNYSVNVKRLTGTRVKVSIIPVIDIANNDIVQFKSESVFGLNTIDIFNTFVKDTKAPTFVDAFNRTVNGNSTNILTTTNVNITIFGLDDLYLKEGNFSHNASGSWTNQSIAIRGNQTPYHYIIGSGNFTANQVVGWKFYVYDLAGNQLDPIYTFTVGSVPSTPTTSSGGSDSGSTTGSITIPQSLKNPFGLNPVGGTCAQKEQLYDEKCYPCDPAKGYLKFNTDDRSVLCIECAEGFEFVNGGCKLLPPKSVGNTLNKKIDYYAKIISNTFNTDNLLIGYFILVIVSIIIINYLFQFLNNQNDKK